MKLEIGGERKKDGWVVLNADDRYGIDIVTTVPPLPSFVVDRQWDEVAAFHVIEHCYLWEAQELVKQVYWCLVPGGRFIVELPDVEYCMRVFLGLIEPPSRRNEGQFSTWGLWGDPNHKNPLYCHKWGYTPASLTDLFVEAGFKRALVTQEAAETHFPVRDCRLVGVKEKAETEED